MSETETSDELVGRKALQHFFFPLDESALFHDLDHAIGRALPMFSAIAKAFRHNLESVVLTVSVPYQLTAVSTQQLRFQQVHLAEKIRARKLILEGETEEKAERKAFAIANERFSEELKKPEIINRFSKQILAELEQSLSREEFGRAASELLRQGTVSVWGALEVLVQDIFVSLVNAKPNLAIEILTNEQSKRLFQLKAIPLDILSSCNFDLSGCFGDILIRNRSVDTIPAMKAVFRVVLPKSNQLHDILEKKELWVLNQRRHLIVHRRGVVDADYIASTGNSLSVGDELIISPDELEQYLKLVLEAGVELINEMTAHHS
jgi:hypothetical protein